MLQVVLGFSAERIGGAFLVAPTAMGQRLVRAKKKIRDADIGFDVPEPAEWRARFAAVLDAIYAAYGAGWSDPLGADPSGAAWRKRLCGWRVCSPRSYATNPSRWVCSL
jgi:RNA polymerase sigma-70 factor (ECF subfamily)